MPEAARLDGAGSVALDETAFAAPFHEALVHECVRAELAARRRGTHATKDRAEVRGGSAKPWRQKGTGRARQGSIRAPHFTGGGVAFGPTPRRYTFKVNRKERRAALRSALSVHAGRGSIAVFEAEPFEQPATKQAARLVAEWDQPGALLVVVADVEGDVLASPQGRAALSFRNLERVQVLGASQVGVADLIGAGALLCTPEALDELTARATAEVRA